MPDPDLTAVPLKAYVDGQLTEVRRAVDTALAATQVEGVPLREYTEALLEAARQARDLADTERAKAALSLAEEREKTAQALALSLGGQIKQGDEALRDHIKNQIAQIRDALTAAQALTDEQHRTTNQRVDDAVRRGIERLEGLQREIKLITDASAEAIRKAEIATEKRFESVNEFRAQLSDTISRFLPREVADAQSQELRKQISDIADRSLNKEVYESGHNAMLAWREQVDERLNQMVGADKGRLEQRAGMTVNMQLVLAVVAIVITVLVANHVF